MGKHDWSKWYLIPEQDRPRIKRSRLREDGKRTWQRYPAQKYTDLEGQELEALLRRLNATYEADRKAAEERYNFDHAYINQISKEKFRQKVKRNSKDPGHVLNVMQVLDSYVLEFFIHVCTLPDPSRWHLKEQEWGKWLLGKDLSPKTLMMVVATANRFTKFLVESVYPEMPTPRRLEPLGRAELDEEQKKTKYISPAVYLKILSHTDATDPSVAPNIKLCYALGLRISETLGLKKDKFYKSFVLIDEQGDKVGTTKPTKTEDMRKVPYWNITAKEAWELVQAIQPMHPTTLIRRVNKILSKFGHTSHDFRRTFITDALRQHHWKDVQLAAGHKDVRTTMQYSQDDRGMNDEKADLD